jgi:tripartite-type tricarboxylate transporter receptor subunit TctC
MKVKMKVQESLIRLFLILASTVILGTCVVQAAPANLSLIVSASPGTGLDILARTLSQQFSIKGNYATVVENKAGASGNIAADLVTRAKPDGATLLVVGTTFATNAAVNPNLPFDTVKDFAPVALLGTGTLCLVVPSSSTANTLAEFLQMAKTSAKGVNYASPGNGTPQHLAMELLKFEAGLNLFHVPFKGSAGAVNDVAAGHVSAMIAPVHTVMPLVKAGKLKMLAVLSSERAAQMPQVPTFKEQGLPKVQVDIWYGLMAPKGTSPQVIQSLNQEVNLVLKNPEIVANLAKQGIDAGGGTPQLMAETLSAELKRWPPVVKAAQIKAD